jgi:predicted RNase H-like HicB family nuclease
MNSRTFTAVFEQHEDWWIGWVEELPGAIAQERTLEEARESLRGVIPVLLEVQRETAQAEANGARQVREELTVSV